METRRDRQVIRRRRRLRYRAKVAGTSARPRLCIYRSLNHIYAQVVDDTAGRVIAAAKIVGEVIAARLSEKGVPTVTFDRGGYQYHGRIKAIADSARAKGLKF